MRIPFWVDRPIDEGACPRDWVKILLFQDSASLSPGFRWLLGLVGNLLMVRSRILLPLRLSFHCGKRRRSRTGAPRWIKVKPISRKPMGAVPIGGEGIEMVYLLPCLFSSSLVSTPVLSPCLVVLVMSELLSMFVSVSRSDWPSAPIRLARLGGLSRLSWLASLLHNAIHHFQRMLGHSHRQLCEGYY